MPSDSNKWFHQYTAVWLSRDDIKTYITAVYAAGLWNHSTIKVVVLPVKVLPVTKMAAPDLSQLTYEGVPPVASERLMVNCDQNGMVKTPWRG